MRNSLITPFKNVVLAAIHQTNLSNNEYETNLAALIDQDVYAYTENGQYFTVDIGTKKTTTLDEYLNTLQHDQFKRLLAITEQFSHVDLQAIKDSSIQMGELEDMEGNSFDNAMFIHFDGLAVYDPYTSTCTRFNESPNAYGVTFEKAREIYDHNTGIGMVMHSDLAHHQIYESASRPSAG